MANVLKWKGDGAFQDEVVGESHYQADLGQMATGKRTRVTASLVCEPNNPYDKNAVRVEIEGKLVGHLPRERAKFHRQRLARLNEIGSAVECDAVIATGPDGVSGVFLDLPLTVRGSQARENGKMEAVDVTGDKPVTAPRNKEPIGRLWSIAVVAAIAAFVIGLVIDSALVGFGGIIGTIGLLIVWVRWKVSTNRP